MAYNEADKTHHILDSREKTKAPWMYETGRNFCHVHSFEEYLPKLNLQCNQLFKKSVKKFTGEKQQIWYENSAV